MSSSKLALSFRMFQHGRLIREDTLAQGVIKIGKLASAHVRIDDDAVSRMHAIVERTGGEVTLIDLGSTRGTFVNGTRIHRTTLRSGDVIGIGDTQLELAIGEPAVARGAEPRTPSVIVEAAPAPRPPAIPAAALRGRPSARPALPIAQGPGPEVDAPVGARAVEVAAMLGDSVVGVKHCLDPRSGEVRAATWALVAAGAACLLASAIAFTVSLHTAAVNRERLTTWTRVDGKPAYAFRPRLLGPGVDGIALGGLSLGLVGLALGLVRVRRERQSPYYRIGTAPGVELALEQSPAPAFPLIAPSGDDFVFNYGAGIDGELIVDGAPTPLGELAALGRARPSASIAGAIEVPIPPRARIRARAGQATFLISPVARPRRHAGPLLARLERRAVSYFAGSLAAHLGLWALLQTLPPGLTAANVDVPVIEPLALRVIGAATLEPPPPEASDAPGGGGDSAGETVAMPLPSGTAGSPEGTRDLARRQVARVAEVPQQLSREQAIEYARTAGVLGSALLRSDLHALDATELIASGFDDANLEGAIYGGEGPGRGDFGQGLSGASYGGGCLGVECGATISAGRYRTIGPGPGTGVGFRMPGRNGTGLPSRTQLLPQAGDVKVIGADYSKAIIRRYILRYREQLAYCYEKQLLAHPDLSGQVMATFFIGATGSVQSASATGVHPEVASCIATVIKTISFPPPREGVQVNYPFNIRRAGQ